MREPCQRSAVFLAMMTFSFTLPADERVVMEEDPVQLDTMTIIALQKKEFGIDEPISIQTIDRQEIERVKFSRPEQILKRIPGTSLSRNFRFAERDKGYTAALIDGVANRGPYQGSTGLIEDTNTFGIERIEASKGPASALNWNNTFGGVINVISRDPAKEGRRKFWFEGGTYSLPRWR